MTSSTDGAYNYYTFTAGDDDITVGYA